MPRVTIVEPHALGVDEAVRRLKELSKGLQRRFAGQVDDIDAAWYGPVLDVKLVSRGVKLTATVHVGASDVTCHLEVPLIAMMYRAKAEAAIRSELRARLGSG